MNSLILGFLYVVGLSWLLCETCIMASNGNWGPFWWFLGGFSVLFAVVGCWPMSDRSVSVWGSVFALAAAISLLLISVASFGSGVAIGILKLVAAVLMLGLALLSFLPKRENA